MHLCAVVSRCAEIKAIEFEETRCVSGTGIGNGLVKLMVMAMAGHFHGCDSEESGSSNLPPAWSWERWRAACPSTELAAPCASIWAKKSLKGPGAKGPSPNNNSRG